MNLTSLSPFLSLQHNCKDIGKRVWFVKLSAVDLERLPFTFELFGEFLSPKVVPSGAKKYVYDLSRVNPTTVSSFIKIRRGLPDISVFYFV